MSSFLDRYSEISKELGFEYVKKGSPEYNRIMEVMNNRFPRKKPSETQIKWSKSCEALGYKFVRKGTVEYDRVKEYFDREKDN